MKSTGILKLRKSHLNDVIKERKMKKKKGERKMCVFCLGLKGKFYLDYWPKLKMKKNKINKYR